jgi:hypothetical protein
MAATLTDLRFRIFCWRAGFLNTRQLLVIAPAYFVFELLGGTVRKRLYRLVRVKTDAAQVLRMSDIPVATFSRIDGSDRMISTPNSGDG